MKTSSEILNALSGYYGTESYHRHSPLFPRFLLTDGARALADLCQCYWFFDIVASLALNFPKVNREPFQVWKISREGDGAAVVCTDGNDNVLYRKKIEFTDFPLDSYEIFCQTSGTNWIAMLKSEY